MAQAMTAVWLILLTIVICAVVPVMFIVLTSPHKANTEMIMGFENILNVVDIRY